MRGAGRHPQAIGLVACPAHPIAKAFEEYRARFQRPEGTMEWSVTTIGARTLQGTCPGGPNIRAVIRRRTTRLSDNALIDDVDLSIPIRK